MEISDIQELNTARWVFSIKSNEDGLQAGWELIVSMPLGDRSIGMRIFGPDLPEMLESSIKELKAYASG